MGVMTLWGRMFAASYDWAMAATEEAGMSGHRSALLARVNGSVLELGGGTGANLPYFSRAVEELVITEPEEAMARRLEAKVVDHALSVRVVRAPAELLPFDPESFDAVVSTLVLCTVEDPVLALAEVHRVLRPGGRLVFVEHVRSADPGLARWQDRLHRPWKALGYGCNCNRATAASIEQAGFSFVELADERLPKAPPIVRPLIVGIAEKSS